MKHLPTDAKERKTIPLWSGLMQYFPDALVAVAQLSYIGNQQHNPGQPLHWAREKSVDQEDTLLRHLLERGTIDVDGVRHTTKAAWRALALLQLEIEKDQTIAKAPPTNPTTGGYSPLGAGPPSTTALTRPYASGRIVVREAVPWEDNRVGTYLQSDGANNSPQVLTLRYDSPRHGADNGPDGYSRS